MTRIITFGDWSICKEGNFSKEFLLEAIDNIDSIAFLGDMAYDLNSNEGEKGNEFLEFSRNITSKVPFMVYY
jgi:hypothetical protein